MVRQTCIGVLCHLGHRKNLTPAILVGIREFLPNDMARHSARPAGKFTPLLLAGILALTGPLPAKAIQRVALPNGEVLHFGGRGGTKPRHSTTIMQKEHGPGSVAWHILAGTPPIIWDPGDKEVVASWMGSKAGKAVINKWMTKGDTQGTVFHNADVVLKDYFGVSSR